MSRCRVYLGSALRLWWFALTTCVLASGPLSGSQDRDESAYLQRGRAVERQFTEYDGLYQHYRELLFASVRLSGEHSELLSNSKGLKYGYQILPQVVVKAKPSTTHSRTYSWPETERLIAEEKKQLGDALRKLTTIEPTSQKNQLGQLARDFKRVTENRDRLQQHLEHNRFWQAEIARNKKRFTEQSETYQLVMDRAQVLKQLEVELPIGKRVALKREGELLQRKIEARQPRKVAVPSFVSMRMKDRDTLDGKCRVELTLPVYSDIVEQRFLEIAERVVEKFWRVEDSQTIYCLDVELRQIDPKTLYDGKVPRRGYQIDVNAHVKLFPPDGAVLTTGARTTHAIVGRYVALGPGRTLDRTLAHEFGHMLGFVDRYVRGFRDIGPDGYEILEAVYDPSDLMAAPGSGQIYAEHFERIVRVLEQRNILRSE